jgi:TRAP-type C4-dicarboxylate transport system permease small subunit
MGFRKLVGLLSDGMNSAARVLVALGAASFAILLFAGVVARYVFQHPLIFSAEVVKLLFIWSTFLATSIAYKEKIHIRFEFINKRLGKKGVWLTEIAVHASAMVFFAVIIAKLGEFIAAIWGTFFPIIGLSQGWLYVSVLVSFTVMLVHALVHLLDAVDDYPGTVSGTRRGA